MHIICRRLRAFKGLSLLFDDFTCSFVLKIMQYQCLEVKVIDATSGTGLCEAKPKFYEEFEEEL